MAYWYYDLRHERLEKKLSRVKRDEWTPEIEKEHAECYNRYLEIRAFDEHMRMFRKYEHLDKHTFPIFDYEGKTGYRGPAVRTNLAAGVTLQDIIRVTDISLVCEDSGKSDVVVYPGKVQPECHNMYKVFVLPFKPVPKAVN